MKQMWPSLVRRFLIFWAVKDLPDPGIPKIRRMFMGISGMSWIEMFIDSGGI